MNKVNIYVILRDENERSKRTINLSIFLNYMKHVALHLRSFDKNTQTASNFATGSKSLNLSLFLDQKPQTLFLIPQTYGKPLSSVHNDQK